MLSLESLEKNLNEIMHPKVNPELEKLHTPIEIGFAG